jgi:hypothetical protein
MATSWLPKELLFFTVGQLYENKVKFLHTSGLKNNNNFVIDVSQCKS